MICNVAFTAAATGCSVHALEPYQNSRTTQRGDSFKASFLQSRKKQALHGTSCSVSGDSDSSVTAHGEADKLSKSCSSSERGTIYQQVQKPVTRRQLALGATGMLASAGGVAWPQHAQAIRAVQLPDGSTEMAYELDIAMQVVALRGTIPADVNLEFKTALSKYGHLKLSQRGQLKDIFDELNNPRKKGSAARADAVTLGDAWLAPAIRAGLLQPIPGAQSSAWWGHLPPRWKALVTRDSDGMISRKGQVWACPYRWGCTLIAYRKSALLRRGGRPVEDWGDLLQPKLEGRIAWADSPREFVGAALRTMGMQFNSSAAELAAAGVSEAALAAAVAALRKQVRVFSSREHTRALSAGDVFAVVGWSGDLLPLAERMNDIVLVAPASGTALWADMWAVPWQAQNGSKMEGPSPLLPAWLDFWLQPSRAAWNRGLKRGASPLLLPPEHTAPEQEAPPSEAKYPGIEQGFGDMLPTEDILARSQFLEPLDEPTKQLYSKVLHGR